MKGLTEIEQKMASAYVLVYTRIVNKHVRAEDYANALDEARGIVAALERLAESGGDA